MIGLVLGSLFVTFPGLPVTVPYTILCMTLFLTGFILAIMLGRFEHKNKLETKSKEGNMV